MKAMCSPVKVLAGKKFILPSFFFLLITLFIPVTQAYGIHTHDGTEGLISHQLGHFLFTSAMVVLLLRWSKSHLTGPGWYEFRGFLWVVILWNICTFTGHWMREAMKPDFLVYPNGHVAAFQINTFPDLIFYLTNLDYLFMVPAFFLLFLAIRKWGNSE